MKKHPKKIPVFKSMNKESEFWDKNDTTDFIDWNQAHLVKFTNLKPTSRSISLRLPEGLLDRIKLLANKQDVPYQSLMKILLLEGLNHYKERLKI